MQDLVALALLTLANSQPIAAPIPADTGQSPPATVIAPVLIPAALLPEGVAPRG